MNGNLLFWPYLTPPPKPTNVKKSINNIEKTKEVEEDFDLTCGYEKPHYTTSIEL